MALSLFKPINPSTHRNKVSKSVLYRLVLTLCPPQKKITVVVKNPQGIRVQQWKNLDTKTGFISKVLDLGDFVLNGNWTVQAFYGHQFIHNTSIKFEVRGYVLPTFSVKITGPSVILPTDISITVGIASSYTHGKSVEGTLAVRIKIVGMKQEPILISSFRMRILDGFATLTIKRRHIMDLPGNIWFPEGRRLEVEADVTESSTGITEHAIENSIFFSSSKYRIKFYKTAKYFKPGLPFSVKVIASYPDDKPAPNIDVRISAKAIKSDGSETDVGRHADDIKDEANRDVTGANGQAEFVIDIPRDVKTLKVKVETAEKGLPLNQNAVKELITRVYTSKSNEYLMLRQTKPVRVGRTVFCDAFLSSGKVDKLSYMVVSRGQIVVHNVVVKKFGVSATISFQVTSMMSPSARLVAYYISSGGEVIADSILLEVDDSLPNQIQIKDNEHEITRFPALEYTVNVLGKKGTRVGILGVDQSVYLLRNDNRLTPKRVFDELENLDLGCGVGSGKDTQGVFKNAGIAVIAPSLAIPGRQDFKCDDSLPRQKRSVNQNSDLDPQTFCCKLGNATDENQRSCIRRVYDLDVPEYTGQKLRECIRHFLKCCVRRFGAKDMGALARSGDFGDFGDFAGPSDDELIEMTQVRSYFPETWIYEEKVIGDEENHIDCQKYLQKDQCGRAMLEATLPHTITSWVVQAVAVSNTSGFGIAKPLHIKTFKPFFMRFTMPYSAQLGEQISILATVYNYNKEETAVKFYLFGNEGFCSAAPSDERVLLTNKDGVKVKAGGSLSLPIAIVPIKYGLVPIKVAVLDSRAFKVDIVEKKLLVVVSMSPSVTRLIN
ncbi:complement C3-like isoform X2 [Actinia tenebrosa]|uniref:Complement C3-like isoform X2 n=1 Tax=Actinia tenebrosa TaxID=6105 RepID=A0A6P8J496_ACTTE|nr:complement C3-like isoform X2 [Actinia tenebrosa]